MRQSLLYQSQQSWRTVAGARPLLKNLTKRYSNLHSRKCHKAFIFPTLTSLQCCTHIGSDSVVKSRKVGSIVRTFSSNIAAATAADNDADNSNYTPFFLADIGEGIKEVELLQWFVQPGDVVQQFDKVCEVQSDKATVEITSRYDGIVHQLAGQVGDMMQVGSPLLFLSTTNSNNNDDNLQQQQRNEQKQGSMKKTEDKAKRRGDSKSSNMLLDEDKNKNDVLLNIPTVASHFHLRSDDDGDLDGNTTKDSDQKLGNGYSGKFQTSPAVRKLGKEYNLDLSTIHGSGPRGRLLKCDVITYLKEQGRWREATKLDENMNESVDGNLDLLSVAANTTKVTSQSFSITSLPPSPLRSSLPPISDASTNGDTIIKLKGYHRLMVQSMTAALSIPHMCFGDEINVTKLVSLRRDLKKMQHSNINNKINVNINVMCFMIKAISLAMKDYPIINSHVHSVESCELKQITNHDIGIAMDTPRGLVVPVIRACQNLSLYEIQARVDELRQAAMSSQLTSSDFDPPPSFTLSNVGSIGGTYTHPIIVPPQVATVAMGKIQRLPRFDTDENGNLTDSVIPTDILVVSWSGDHRFLDGGTLARFNGLVKRYLENPSQMLLHLK